MHILASKLQPIPRLRGSSSINASLGHYQAFEIFDHTAPSRAAEVVHCHSTIGESLVVKGELSGSEDLVVDGEVDGSIALQGHSLTVLPVVLQVSNADKFVAERLSCVLRLPNRKGCR